MFMLHKNYQTMLEENIKKVTFNKYRFSNQHINKFILLLEKRVYPYEYMNDWKNVNDTIT